MTDEASAPPHPAKPDEAQASLRTELAGQIAAAQSELETQLAALQHAAGTNALSEELQGQLQVLHGLSQFLSTAHGASLYQIRAEVATSVAASRSISQQAQGIVTAAQAGQAADHMAELATARDDTRRTTDDFLHDFYEKRIFDPYLHFDTPEDERAYREREAQRQQEIEKAQALNTPLGDLNALNIAREQLEDAGAHGADRSPQYQRTLEQLNRQETSLTTAISQSSNGKTDAAVLAMPADQPDHAKAAANLKDAGVILADQTKTGHGVNVDVSIAAALGRC